MKKTTIISGGFTSGEGKQGNFTGYNVTGERIFIHKNTMKSLGWTKNEHVKFPFTSLTDIKEINTLDENGEPTDKTVKRLQALSVFKNDDDLVLAYNADRLLDIRAESDFRKAATTAGLSEKAVSALLQEVV